MLQTKETKKEKLIINRINKFINELKYLSNPKYYKNNYWSCAAYDSWVAQGKCGKCKFCSDNPTSRLCNKRHNAFCRETHKGYMCYKCTNKIEEIINYKFKRY